ncbi:MAG: hypothetical protein ACTHNP_10005 [Solirubrobacterales bacterium]
MLQITHVKPPTTGVDRHTRTGRVRRENGFANRAVDDFVPFSRRAELSDAVAITSEEVLIHGVDSKWNKYRTARFTLHNNWRAPVFDFPRGGFVFARAGRISKQFSFPVDNIQVAFFVDCERPRSGRRQLGNEEAFRVEDVDPPVFSFFRLPEACNIDIPERVGGNGLWISEGTTRPIWGSRIRATRVFNRVDRRGDAVPRQ